ncbi:hypothetical protein Pint_02527 [Pistacia integerrima]|uniref:Uncharacterized protein n=1 Tax=Pistacia integerrima TaxID=434235 RepID=A0ACC0ZRK4_9ROSI|nr:hypothetical protein Pint_02527 [Pistacia integerrima]
MILSKSTPNLLFFPFRLSKEWNQVEIKEYNESHLSQDVTFKSIRAQNPYE